MKTIIVLTDENDRIVANSPDGYGLEQADRERLLNWLNQQLPLCGRVPQPLYYLAEGGVGRLAYEKRAGETIVYEDKIEE